MLLALLSPLDKSICCAPHVALGDLAECSLSQVAHRLLNYVPVTHSLLNYVPVTHRLLTAVPGQVTAC